MLSSGYGMACAEMTSQQLCVPALCWACQQSIMAGGQSQGHHLSLVNYGLLRYFWRGAAISPVVTNEITRLHCTDPNPRAPRQLLLNSVSQKRNNMNMEKRQVRRGRGE